MVCDYHDHDHDTNNQMDRLRPCAYDSGIGTEGENMKIIETPAVLSTEDYQSLWRALAILGSLGGNTSDSPYRKAWWELRDVVHLKVQTAVEERDE
jgi:hypothetical protein